MSNPQWNFNRGMRDRAEFAYPDNDRVLPLCDEDLAPADENGYCVEIEEPVFEPMFIDVWLI